MSSVAIKAVLFISKSATAIEYDFIFYLCFLAFLSRHSLLLGKKGQYVGNNADDQEK